MTFLPIENHGVVGNMHTAALVGVDGTIDWMCHPHFDSPSVFAALVDAEKGGRFRIRPEGDPGTLKQFYWPDTNVLVTRFLAPEGVGQVTDFMPAGLPSDDPRRHWLVRLVETVRGHLPFVVECAPAFDYARSSHRLVLSKTGARFHGSTLSLQLASTVPLQERNGSAVGRFELGEGETAVFVLSGADAGETCTQCVPGPQAEELLRHTVAY